MGIYIQYILHSLVLIFDPKGGGRVYSDWMLFEFFMKYIFFKNNSFSLHVFSSRFMKNILAGGGERAK